MQTPILRGVRGSGVFRCGFAAQFRCESSERLLKAREARPGETFRWKFFTKYTMHTDAYISKMQLKPGDEEEGMQEVAAHLEGARLSVNDIRGVVAQVADRRGIAPEDLHEQKVQEEVLAEVMETFSLEKAEMGDLAEKVFAPLKLVVEDMQENSVTDPDLQLEDKDFILKRKFPSDYSISDQYNMDEILDVRSSPLLNPDINFNIPEHDKLITDSNNSAELGTSLKPFPLVELGVNDNEIVTPLWMEVVEKRNMLPRFLDDCKLWECLVDRNPLFVANFVQKQMTKRTYKVFCQFLNKLDMHECTKEFIKDLARQGQLNIVNSMASNLLYFDCRAKGLLPVTAETAVPMLHYQKEALRANLRGCLDETDDTFHDVFVRNVVDETVVGGLRLWIHGYEYVWREQTVGVQLARILKGFRDHFETMSPYEVVAKFYRTPEFIEQTKRKMKKDPENWIQIEFNNINYCGPRHWDASQMPKALIDRLGDLQLAKLNEAHFSTTIKGGKA